MIPVPILGQKLLSVQEFAVQGTCITGLCKEERASPLLLLNGLVGESDGVWYS